MERWAKLYKKHKGLVLYIVFGVLTTIVNQVVFSVSNRILIGVYGIDRVEIPVVLAWIFAVTFAYLTNRVWVFESEAKNFKEISKEVISFFLCRVFSLLVEIAFMKVTVDILGYNPDIMKFVSNVIVVIINYILSKLVIFRKGKK